MQRQLSAPGPEAQVAGACAQPHFSIDADLGLIVEANAQARMAWGLEAENPALPIALDRAMPALHSLARLSASCTAHRKLREELTFWTARGLQRWRCNIRLSDATRKCFAIEVVGSSTDAEGAGSRQHTAGMERLAHELRTPLSAVIAYAEVLKDEHFGPMANDRYRDYARNIHDSARHALGVVDGMLGAGAGHSNSSQFAFRDLDPCAIVDDCLAVARPLAAEAGLELSAEVPAAAPRIVADEVSLKQMLLNLLTNAIKFTRAGDRVIVGVGYEPGGPLSIAVTDTGPGMSQLPLALQGGKAGRRERGLRNAGRGIGLPLTRALAEANGASLVIDSMPGHGTRAAIVFGSDRVVPV
jgi:signal transduction histidine kinase